MKKIMEKMGLDNCDTIGLRTSISGVGTPSWSGREDIRPPSGGAYIAPVIGVFSL